MADEFDFLDQFGVSESDASQPTNAYESRLMIITSSLMRVSIQLARVCMIHLIHSNILE